MSLKSTIKNWLSPKSRQRLLRHLTELKTIGHGSDLNKLALIYETDKWGAHFYTQHYMRYLRTAYWPSWGATKRKSSMDFLKSLLDGLNHVDNPLLEQPAYFHQHITEIAFFHNLCFIRKADNDEPSKLPQLVEKERQFTTFRLGCEKGLPQNGI